MDAATSASNGARSNRLIEHHPGCRIPNCFCELWPSIVYNPSGPMYPKRYIDKFADDEVQYAKQKLQTKAERAAKVKEPVSNNNSASVAKSKRKRTAGEDELVDDDDDGDSKYARHRDLMVRDLVECCLEAVPLEVLHTIPASTFRGDVDDAIAGKTVIYRLRDRMDFRRYPGLRDYLLNRHRNSLWQDSQADVEAVIRMLEAGTVTGKLTLGHITDLKHPLRVLNVDSAAGAFATVPLRAGEPLGVYPGVLTPYNELNSFMGLLPMSERSKIWSYDIEAPINGYSFHGAGVRNVLCGVNDFHGIDDEEGNSVSKVPLKLGGVIPMILFVTRRAIAQGQELTLSYGHEWSKVFTTYHPAAREIFFANKRDNEPSIGEMYQLVGLARAERTRSSLKLKAAGGADAVAAEMLKRATKVSQLKSASKQGPGGGAGSGSPAASNGLSCDTFAASGGAAGLVLAGLESSPVSLLPEASSSTVSTTVGAGVRGVAAMSSGGHDAHSSIAPLPVPLPTAGGASTSRMHTSTTYVPSPLAAVQRARDSTASALGGLSLSSVPVLQVGGTGAAGTGGGAGPWQGQGQGGTKVDFVTQVAAAVSTGKLALAPGASAADESALRARVASVGHYDHLGAGLDCGLCPGLQATQPTSSSSSSSSSSSAGSGSGAGHVAGTHALLPCRYKSWEEASKKLNFAVAARVAVAEAAAVAAQRAKRAAALALQRAEEGKRAAAAAAAASPVAKTPGKRKVAASKVRKAAVGGEDEEGVGAAAAPRKGKGKSKGSRHEQPEDEEEDGQEEELDEGEEAEEEEEEDDAGASSSVPVFVPPPPPVLAPLPAEPSLLLVDVSEVLASLDALEEARASSPTGTAEASSGEERYTEVLASLLCKAVEAGVTMTDGSELVPGIVLPAGASAEQLAEPSPKDGLPQPSPAASASSAASGAGFVPIPPEPRRTAVLSRVRDWVDEQREVANTYADALDAREAALAAHASAVAAALAEAQAAAAAAASASKPSPGGRAKGGSARPGKGSKAAARAGKRQREEDGGGDADAPAAVLGDSARSKKKKKKSADAEGEHAVAAAPGGGQAGTAGANPAKKEARAARKAAKKAAKAAKAAKKAGRPSAPAAAGAGASVAPVASTPGTNSKDKAGAKRAASASAAGKDKGSSTAKKARVSSAGPSGETSTATASAHPPAATVDVLSLGTKEYNTYLTTLPSHLQEAVAIPGLSRIQQRQLLASMLAEHVSGASHTGGGGPSGASGAAPTHTHAPHAQPAGTGKEEQKRSKGKSAETVADAGSAPSSAPEGGVEGAGGTEAHAAVTVPL